MFNKAEMDKSSPPCFLRNGEKSWEGISQHGYLGWKSFVMAKVEHYTIRFHGGQYGLDGVHAQIHLFGNHNHLLGWINFVGPSRAIDQDKQHEKQVVMEMPLSMLESMLSALRDEAPVYLYWQTHLRSAYFGTGQEPVGEGEH